MPCCGMQYYAPAARATAAPALPRLLPAVVVAGSMRMHTTQSTIAAASSAARPHGPSMSVACAAGRCRGDGLLGARHQAGEHREPKEIDGKAQDEGRAPRRPTSAPGPTHICLGLHAPHSRPRPTCSVSAPAASAAATRAGRLLPRHATALDRGTRSKRHAAARVACCTTLAWAQLCRH